MVVLGVNPYDSKDPQSDNDTLRRNDTRQGDMMNDPLLSVCTEKLYYHPSNGGGREGGTVNRREHLEEAGGKGYLAADGSACRGSAPATLLEEYRVHGTEAPKSECPYISQSYPDY